MGHPNASALWAIRDCIRARTEACCLAGPPFDFALSKIPLLAQRTREKWGTQMRRHHGRFAIAFTLARSLLLGRPALRLRSVENPHFSRIERARNGAPKCVGTMGDSRLHSCSHAACCVAGPPFDFALSKIPLLAQRTREKWGQPHRRASPERDSRGRLSPHEAKTDLSARRNAYTRGAILARMCGRRDRRGSKIELTKSGGVKLL